MPDKNPRHAVIITITPELLADLLRLPPGIRLTGAAMNSPDKVLSLRLDAPHFPVVVEGTRPVQAKLTYNPKMSRIDL